METTFWLVFTILLFLGAFYYFWNKYLKNRGRRLHTGDKFSGSTQTISSEIIHKSPLLLQNNIKIMIQPTIQLELIQRNPKSSFKDNISSTSDLDKTVVVRGSESSEMIASIHPIYSKYVTSGATNTSEMLQIFAYFSNKKEAESIIMDRVVSICLWTNCVTSTIFSFDTLCFRVIIFFNSCLSMLCS